MDVAKQVEWLKANLKVKNGMMPVGLRVMHATETREVICDFVKGLVADGFTRKDEGKTVMLTKVILQGKIARRESQIKISKQGDKIVINQAKLEYGTSEVRGIGYRGMGSPSRNLGEALRDGEINADDMEIASAQFTSREWCYAGD